MTEISLSPSTSSLAPRWSRDGNLGFGLIVGVVFVLTVAPIWFLIEGSLQVSSTSGGHSSLVAVLLEPRYWGALKNSLILGLAVATITTALVGIVCWFVTRTDVPGRRVWTAIIPVPIAIGPIVGSMAWIGLFSPRGVGLVNNLTNKLWGGDLLDVYTMTGLITVMVFVFAPFAFLFMYGGFTALASDHEEAARVHGASLSRIISRISFPATRSTLIGGWVMLFAMSIQNLSIYALVGSRSHIDTVPNAMYRLTQSAMGQSGEANVLALLIIIPSLIALGGHVIYTRRIGSQRVVGRQVGPSGIRLGRLRYPVFALLLLYVLFMVILPLGSLTLSSFLRFQTSRLTWKLFTLDNYRQIFEDPDIHHAFYVTLTLSLIVATVGTVLSLILAYVANRRRGLLANLAGAVPILMLAIPGFALGLGYLWASYSNPEVRNFSGSIIGMSIAVMLAYLGFGARVFAASLNQFGVAYEEAGRIAGKSTWVRLTRIIAPMMLPSALAVWRLMVVLAIMEFNITALLFTNQNIPLSVFMFLQLDTQPASGVYALGVCQLVPIILVFVLTVLPGRRLRRER
ncbi:MAG TPA: iron ABC transporter permease [Dongiaceae bacterium]|jgi:iron(III) transport system permease protein|nr:iron ABC transporter permease [Dongiaceae bacterium]